MSKGRFNINGLEIDLAELDAFERRVAEKRVQQRLASNESAVDVATVDESTVDKYDDLDEYLERLQLSEAPRSNSRSNGHPEPSLPPATVMEESKRPSFLQLLYLFMSILSLANIFYRLDNPPPSEQAIGLNILNIKHEHSQTFDVNLHSPLMRLYLSYFSL